MCLCDVLPNFGLRLHSQLILHFSASSVTLVIILLDYLQYDEKLILKADPLFTVIAAIGLSVAALPALFQSVRLLLFEIPKGFQVEEFKKEINSKFAKTTCDHLHIYKKEGDNTFDAFLCVTYRCSMDDPQWRKKAQSDVVRIQSEIRSVLVKAGGKGITVQPFIVDERHPTKWDHCLYDDCRRKSCCQPSSQDVKM